VSGVTPYLIRAYCYWIEDSGLTPHILVNCEKNGVTVPDGFAKEGKVVLNISSPATTARLLTNKFISFKARFNGALEQIIVPCDAVLTIYAQESGEGIVFEKKSGSKSLNAKKNSLTLLD